MKVLVVSKETQMEQISRQGLSAPTTSKVAQREIWNRVRRDDELHRAGLLTVLRTLDQLGWEHELVQTSQSFSTEGLDLVITVGGDGTVLHASHYTVEVPLLAVNSNPHSSIGYFCATTAEGFETALRAFENGSLSRFVLHRLRVELNGQVKQTPALNDVLIAHRSPAATSRYVLVAGPRAEFQCSGGLWISTPAGSTAAIRAAGGVVLPLEAAQLQYLVRDPVFPGHQNYELLKGVRGLEEGITIVSQMVEGMVYIDGPWVQEPFSFGMELKISAHHPLTLLGLEPSRRER
ncbi:MAG: NAD(+)/NADH kinase [Bradymonadales bacterium]|nr:NAD(+)/NADH kinase [Bradymonadales bacterium]